jgi:hypothetical protein
MTSHNLAHGQAAMSVSNSTTTAHFKLNHNRSHIHVFSLCTVITLVTVSWIF